MDEGYIKFKSNWIKTGPFDFDQFGELNSCRTRIYQAGLIGMGEDGIGYGNVSVRIPKSNQFIISGTQTGGIPALNRNHYTQVISYSLDKNSLTSKGPVEASSESLTHAALYELDAGINAVIHVHHFKLWEALQKQGFPATAQEVLYGTPEMAKEVKRLMEEPGVIEKQIIVMSGHESGTIVFSENIQNAESKLMTIYQEMTG